MVCIGVPYGTSLWQVADSKEQNGSFKIAISKAKKKLVETRLDMHMDSPGVYTTDIMTIIDEAWSQSFAQVEQNKRAISARGWGPLNYNLLNDEDIKSTMTESENREYHSMLKTENENELNPESLTTSISATSMSDLTADDYYTGGNKSDQKRATVLNYDQKYLTKVISNSVTLNTKLNFTSGKAADVARRILHDHDIRQAREANQVLSQKGERSEG